MDNQEEQQQAQENQENKKAENSQGEEADKEEEEDDAYVDDMAKLPTLDKEIDGMCTTKLIQDSIKGDHEEVARVFQGDPAKLFFKTHYETFYQNLKKLLITEANLAKKCKEDNHEILMTHARIRTSKHLSEDDQKTAKQLEKEINQKLEETKQQKSQEKELKTDILNLNEDIENLDKNYESEIKKVEKQCEKERKDKVKEEETLQEQLQKEQNKVKKIKEENKKFEEVLKEKQDRNQENQDQIDLLTRNIADIEAQMEAEEDRKQKVDSEMELIKKQTEEANALLSKKEEEIYQNKADYKNLKQKFKKKNKQREKIDKEKHQKQEKKKDIEKQISRKKDQIAAMEKQVDDQQIELEKKMQVNKELSKIVKKKLKEQKIIVNKKIEAETLRNELERKRDQLASRHRISQEKYDDFKKIIDDAEEKLEKMRRERNTYGKVIKQKEVVNFMKEEEINDAQNKKKKLQNQVRGYQIEAAKLNKIVNLLEKEQEKYGIDASQAHARYYQTVEEVKIKNNIIAEFQKKNQELQAKLKHQQNLYEAVRSDRNLYSKNLLESQEEIGELTKKYTRMTHSVDQLKEEIKLKDTALVKEDVKFHQIVKDVDKTKLEQERYKDLIKKKDIVIQSQNKKIGTLKHIITEAKAERKRQQKDYDMVMNEKDILCQQLIKRNHELDQIYEKLKISQSSLAKGEIYYMEKTKEFDTLREHLRDLKKELIQTQDQIECIHDLKSEANSLEKEILNEKTKVKALEDELKNPMNVHRWRKLEATSQGNYEKILKIQTLQRRLIAKTEEVNDKGELIKQKEKLFMELKNILARQPGQEIHGQLVNYRKMLKEKSSQMKKILGELKAAKEQVDIHKLEVNRIKNDIHTLKRRYFKQREKADRERAMQEAQAQVQAQMENLPAIPGLENIQTLGSNMQQNLMQDRQVEEQQIEPSLQQGLTDEQLGQQVQEELQNLPR